MSTITVPPVMPSVQQDCQALHHAMKGFGCNEKHVIEIIGHRTTLQRRELVAAYRGMYGEDLPHRLEKELRGNLEKAVLLWMMEPAERDAIILRDAMKGVGTKDKALIEIICTRAPSQIHAIRHAYQAKYQRSLDRDIESDTSGYYKKLLLAYASGLRYEGPEVDMNLAHSEAKELYKAGEARLGTDESTFIRIFSTRSATQLNATFQAYKHLYKRDIDKAIKREASGDFEDALRTIAKSVSHPDKYFAKALYKSMKGIGTDDATLIRVIVTRAEFDMHYIKAAFASKYKKSLESMVASDTSGHYKHFLLTLIGSH
ncbi:hypothetical protein O6H91_16G068300 [Diphasiastrum complanatum]|uniref:Uncharacterized protein n=1 Tax=Diphasiastrum complanatum TaxID=34168 RepID=A0ACC2BE57_DIPCM|nr:hypothetical protein O6H91_Y237900 [Diphasiastrum complanatum]KAJ7294721.1 hypothetical protein O6H91_Y237900 [Diphasiastrum complanatum]KAJ7527732.1 hypothetical protein O6H91_16G068300 [Diphasiastrum complanatum]